MADNADIIIKNARIFTSDESNPRAEAIAIKGNRIVYVGTNTGADAFKDASTGSLRMTGDYDMLIFDRGYNLEPQGSVQDTYSSTNIPSADNPDGGNVYCWINPKADEAIATAGSTFDQATRRDAYCQLGKLIQEDAVQNYIYLFQDGYGFSSKLTGYTVSIWGSMTWDAQNWSYK